MASERDGSAARAAEDAPGVHERDPGAEAPDDVPLRALPRPARTAAASAQESFRLQEMLPFSFRAAADMRRFSQAFGGLGGIAGLAGQFERFRRLSDPLGIANLGALHRGMPPHLGAQAILAASRDLQRSLAPTLPEALGSVAALRAQHRFLGDVLRATRAPDFAGLGHHVDAPLRSVLKAARSFERLDTRIGKMFTSLHGEILRRELVAPSLAVAAALGAREGAARVGVLSALPGADAALLAWLRGPDAAAARVQAALLHAERTARSGRRTRRIELPAEVPCDACGVLVVYARPLRFITVVGRVPRGAIRFAALCARCAGREDAEEAQRMQTVLEALDSLRHRKLYLTLLRGGDEGDHAPRGVLRLAYCAASAESR